MADAFQACALACAPARWVRIGHGLLQRADSDPQLPPTLVLGQLEGEAIALGRFQRRSSALAGDRIGNLEVVRRNSGGRALRLGTGVVGVLLAVPGPSQLVGAPVPPDKLMNRFVRGLLAGLTRAGATGGAHYFGRDFVSAQSKRLAAVGQDGTARAALFEAFVAVERTLELPAGLDGYPDHSDPRACGPAEVSLRELRGQPPDFEPLAEAIFEGYASQHRRELARIEPSALPEAKLEPAAEDESGLVDSGLAEIPIGFVEALVRHSGGTLEEARLRGDFIAPAFTMAELEQSLSGCPLTFAELGQRVNAAFHQPGACVIGVRELRIFPEAILAAANALE